MSTSLPAEPVVPPVVQSCDRSRREVWVDEGFAAFVRHRSSRLARTAFLLTADRHLAEDLLQTTLAKVSERWTHIASRDDPTAYVRVVMLRTAISWRRRRWRGEVPTAQLPEVATSDPVAMIDERMRTALVRLPPRQRAALVLRFYEDLSEAETATLLGCSVGTVKSQTSKGLAKLRELLGPPHTSGNGDHS